jgi:hypothetical protein
LSTYNYNPGTNDRFEFRDWYEIQKFDNVTMTLSNLTQNMESGGAATVKFTDCTNALITDTDWTGMYIYTLTTGKNVNASGTNCNTLTPITITGATGPGAGAVYENDPNGVISWP